MECYHERAFYYWRHGYYGHVQLICSFGLEKTSNDLFLRLWKTLSIGFLGRTEDALQQLSLINNREDLSLLLTVSQLCIYNISNHNLQKIKELKKEIERQIKRSNQFCISQSAQVAWMFNNIELSNQIISYSKEPTAIAGWIKMTTGDYSSAEKIFDSIQKNDDSYDLLSLYGKYILFLTTSKIPESSEIHKKIVTRYNFPELNVEKARNSARFGRYDQSVSILKDYEQFFPTTIEIDIFSALSSIIKCADLSTAVKYLDKICQICEKYEKINWKLTSKLALVFGTLSCQDLSIINQTMRLSQLSLKSNPKSPFCLQISALHHIITRNYGVAKNILKSIDYNRKKCTFTNFNSQLILLKNFHQDRELEDSLDLYEKIENTFCISTYRSYLSRRRNQDTTRYIPLIIEDLQKIIKSVNDENKFFTPLEIQYERFLDLFISLRLEIIFDSFDEIAVLNDSVRMPLTGDLGDKIESFITDLSFSLHSYLPLIFVQAVLMFRKKRYLESEFLFQSIVFSKWKYRISECLVYLAQIDLINKKESQAKLKINDAFSLNVQLKDDYNYHLIRTEIFRDQEHLMALIPFFQDSNQPFESILKYLDLAISLDSYDTATQIYQFAKSKISCSMEKGLLILRKAQIQASRNMIDESFDLLEKLKKHSNYFELATITESEICYKYKIGSFIGYLIDLQKKIPDSKHCEMIGDAYVKIIDFINASKWYKKAIEIENPTPDTFHKYISSLVSAHKFDEAVLRFTEYFTKIKQNTFTLVFLMNELIKIERYNEAKKCIDRGIHLINKTNRLAEAYFFGQCGIVSWKLEDIKMARKYFKKAATIYDGIFMDATFFQNNYVSEYREKASFFFISYARFSTSQQKIEKANDLYARACELDESNAEPVIQLVKYYKNRYEVHKCVRLCTEFLRRYPNNERVALELTTVETSNYSSAIKCLTRVLKSHPRFYRILIRLIEICARAGTLHVAEKMITKDGAPGMVLARGLYAMYNGLNSEAIKIFAKIQNHPVWGMTSQLAILQILINPERKYCWCTSGPLSTDEELAKANEMIDKMANPKNIKNKLSDIDELTFEIDPINKVILQADVETSRNTQTSISNAASLYSNIINLQYETDQNTTTKTNPNQNLADKSSDSNANNSASNSSNYFNNSNNDNISLKINSNSNIINNNSNNTLYNSNSKFILNQTQYIAALVGLARCEIRLGNPTKAADLITQILKRKPYHETFSFFEEAYLMRAQLFLNEGNSAQAQHFYLMALQLNKSCKKAWEMSAILYKKSQMYAEAADAFHHCWELSGKNDIEAGYQFALCSLKANKPEDALEMCRMINDVNPLFKDLREKILIPSFKKLKH